MLIGFTSVEASLVEPYSEYNANNIAGVYASLGPGAYSECNDYSLSCKSLTKCKIILHVFL